MFDVRDEMKQLAKRARAIHDHEKGLVLESTKIIARLEKLNAAVNLGFTKKGFAKKLGISLEVYWKRAQAGRVILRFPKIEKLIKTGEVQLSHVNIIAPKITAANEELLLSRIRNKSKREVEYVAATTTLDGRLIDKEPEIELRLRLKKSQIKLLERAIEVLSVRGKPVSQADAIASGLEALLEKKDPLRKAKRAEARRLKAKDQAALSPERDQEKENMPEISQKPSAAALSKPQRRPLAEDLAERDQGMRRLGAARRSPVPAAIKHAVYLRDGGQCSFVGHNGERCQDRAMIEIDHKKLWCRGGQHELGNLTVMCRYHNQALAKRELGRTDLLPQPVSLKGQPDEHRK